MGSEGVPRPWKVVERDWDSGAEVEAGGATAANVVVVVVAGPNDKVGAGLNRPTLCAAAAAVGVTEAGAGVVDVVVGRSAGRREGDAWGVVDVKRVLRRKMTLRRTVIEGSG